MLVVDASVAVAACHTPVGFASLRGHKLLAPQLMITEASSVLHEMAWRGEITKPRAKAMLERLTKAPVQIRMPENLVQAAWNVADELGWAKTFLRAGSISCAMVSAETACGSQVELLGAYSNPEVQGRLRRLSDRLDRLATSGAARCPTARVDRRLRSGLVPKAIMRVLAESVEPMRVQDIHGAVEDLVGQSVSSSSVKNWLSGHARGDRALFVRLGWGRYCLAPDQTSTQE